MGFGGLFDRFRRFWDVVNDGSVRVFGVRAVSFNGFRHCVLCVEELIPFSPREREDRVEEVHFGGSSTWKGVEWSLDRAALLRYGSSVSPGRGADVLWGLPYFLRDAHGAVGSATWLDFFVEFRRFGRLQGDFATVRRRERVVFRYPLGLCVRHLLLFFRVYLVPVRVRSRLACDRGEVFAKGRLFRLVGARWQVDPGEDQVGSGREGAVPLVYHASVRRHFRHNIVGVKRGSFERSKVPDAFCRDQRVLVGLLGGRVEVHIGRVVLFCSLGSGRGASILLFFRGTRLCFPAAGTPQCGGHWSFLRGFHQYLSCRGRLLRLLSFLPSGGR